MRILRASAAALIVAATLTTTPALGAATPPNIVLIISDDQAWTDYGFMGHSDIRTPNLDQLAAESAVFSRGYVPTALCRPSLATMITGQYASVHGITGNDPSPKYAKRDSEKNNAQRAQLISYLDKFETIPAALKKIGYLSHQSGKFWEGSYQHGGFTHGMTRGFPQPGGRHGDDGLKIGRDGLQPIADFLDHAIDENKPFFLWYAPLLPHTPHNPPERLLKKYQSPDRPKTIAKYYAMCEWFDETCGELLTMMDEKGLRENTLVVYACDNGWIQDPDNTKFALRSKQSPYEGGVRNPILFRWPGKIAAAKRPELGSTIDLAPTMLAAAGATPSTDLPGLNLLPNLRDGNPIERDTIFGESFAHDIADIEDPEASLLFRWCIEHQTKTKEGGSLWKLLLTYDGEVNRGAANHPRTERRPQLFDLNSDPHETTSVAESHPDVVARLVAKIDAWYPVEKREVLKTFAP